MKRTLIKELPTKISQEVLVKGFLHSQRTLGKISFLILRDRTGICQITIENPKTIKQISKLHHGTTLEIKGEVIKTEKTELGIELIKPEIKVLNAVLEAMPIEITKPQLELHIDTDLDYRSLTLRHQKYIAIFKIQSVLAQAYREFLISQGFTEFFGPAMTSASSEGGTEVFKLNYFDGQATLAQSNQLYKQIMVGAYERVFGMAKWFRAENSNTRRHLTEGYQYEFEMGFIESFHEVMDMLEAVVRYMIKTISKKCQTELKILGTKLPMMPKEKFPRIEFSEVKKILSKLVSEETSPWKDMTTEGERELCKYTREKYGSDFVFITNFEKGVFYAYKNEQGVYQNFDLLCREAEIVSGGQRVHDYQQMIVALKEANLKPEDFSEYLAIFKHGMPPHGGFGMGLERSTMLFLGLENIREATIFPSDPKRVAGKSIHKSNICDNL
ncbi:aspartate--tRNA(Asn) ligase [Patescibacteria group bacterium]